MFVLDVCLVKFCVGILSIVGMFALSCARVRLVYNNIGYKIFITNIEARYAAEFADQARSL